MQQLFLVTNNNCCNKMNIFLSFLHSIDHCLSVVHLKSLQRSAKSMKFLAGSDISYDQNIISDKSHYI